MISPFRLVTYTIVALVLGAVLGAVLSTVARDRELSARQAAWEASTKALLADSTVAWRHREDSIRAEEAATFALRLRTLEIERSRLLAASVAAERRVGDLRSALAQTTSLAACQAVGDSLAGACSQALATKDSLLGVEGAKTDAARDSTAAVGRALGRLQGQYAALVRQLDSVPPLGVARGWLGFPLPDLTVGVGCSGGLGGMACGLSIVGGFPLRFRKGRP